MRISTSGCLLVCVAFTTGLLAADADDDDKPAPTPSSPASASAGALVLDAATGKPAVGSLPVDFVRSPDHDGPGGAGRYLVAVNSGYGLQFSARTNRGQQSLAVLDLNAKPAPAVIQNVFFPSPQSACVGAVFSPVGPDGKETLYVSGGFENKVWRFRFTPGAAQPISPGSPGPDTKVTAPFYDLAPLAAVLASKRYNAGKAAVYPLGLALGRFLFTANDLDDSLGVLPAVSTVGEGTGAPGDMAGGPSQAKVGPDGARVELRRRPDENVYPYAVSYAPGRADPAGSPTVGKVYVSLWNASAVAVVRCDDQGLPVPKLPPVYIPTGSHPSALLLDNARRRLYVANANDDSVSVIDTEADREIERINVRLAENELPGVSPEGLALSPDGATLYVADARVDAVAVVRLGDAVCRRLPPADHGAASSRLAGLIPTGRYPSALALVGDTLYVGNGKGTGTANSSNDVDDSGRNPNAPNAAFPPNGKGHHEGRGGAYSVALVSGNLLAVHLPDEATLAAWTGQVLRRQGLTAEKKTTLFAGLAGGSPIKHVIYIIKENRTYDQMFGDVKTSGDGTPADGDSSLAIFGAGDAARRPGGPAQDITPNHHALAQRFGLMDRFFVNSEASADGHNWSTAAFSTDYVDKAFRWNYSGRGRTYDFEGFNRLPDTGQTGGEALFDADLTAEGLAGFLRKYLPYTHGSTDVGEPATRYLWDLAARAGLSYRNYGEFVETASAEDLAAARGQRRKTYPDTSPTLVAVPAKASLENHFCPTARSFDLDTPDGITVDSYRARRDAETTTAPGPEQVHFDPLISPGNEDPRFRGVSRVSAFLEEFSRAVARRKKNEEDPVEPKDDSLPALSILRLSNDHTSGMASGKPSPQFYVADNDYALGRLVEAVSRSPYWKDTAIVAVEDDAQDGPDHVDCHRSVALVISAYNRPGALVHDFCTTAGVIRTMEIMLGLPPMNSQDADAAPIDVFGDGPPDLRPYVATLPQLDVDHLLNVRAEDARDKETAAAIRRSDQLNLTHPDAADPGVLNAVIWQSVRGTDSRLPGVRHSPAYELLHTASSTRDADDD